MANTTAPARPGLLPRLYFPLFLIVCLSFAWRPIASGDDTWAHAAVGRWIWTHHAIPRETLFLFSAHQPWVAHSWLSQLLYYGLVNAGGNLGPVWAVLFTTLVVLFIFVLLWRLWRRNGPLSFLTPLCFGLAVWQSCGRFFSRPELFSALFTALLLHTIVCRQYSANYSRAADLRRVVLLFVMFAVWANLHGGVVMGLVLLIGTAVVENIQAAVQRGDKSLARHLAVLAVVALAAVHVNPYGFGYWCAFNAEAMGPIRMIAEWQPVFWQHSPMPPEQYIGAVVLLVLATLAWVLNPGRRWSHLFWLVLMTAVFLSARRNIWLFCLGSLSVLAANAAWFTPAGLWMELRRGRVAPGTAPAPPPAWLRPLARVGAVAALALYFSMSNIGTVLLSPLSRQAGPPTLVLLQWNYELPEGMVGALRALPPTSRVFNDYNHSGYFEWRLNEHMPLFIDLLNAYPADLFLEYGAIKNSPELFERRRFDVVAICTPKPNEKWPPLCEYLASAKDWKVVYRQGDGIIWQRQVKPS